MKVKTIYITNNLSHERLSDLHQVFTSDEELNYEERAISFSEDIWTNNDEY